VEELLLVNESSLPEEELLRDSLELEGGISLIGAFADIAQSPGGRDRRLN